MLELVEGEWKNEWMGVEANGTVIKAENAST